MNVCPDFSMSRLMLLLQVGLVAVAVQTAEPASADEFELLLSAKLIRTVNAERPLPVDQSISAVFTLKASNDAIIKEERAEGDAGQVSVEMKLPRLQARNRAYREVVLEVTISHRDVSEEGSRQVAHLRFPAYVTASRVEVPVYFFVRNAVDDEIYRLNALREGVRADWARYFLLGDLFEVKYASGSKKAAAVAAWYLLAACARLASAYDETTLYFNYTRANHCTGSLDRIKHLANQGDDYGLHLARIFGSSCTWRPCLPRFESERARNIATAEAALGKLFGYAVRHFESLESDRNAVDGLCSIFRYFHTNFANFRKLDENYLRHAPGNSAQFPELVTQVDEQTRRCPAV